MTRSEVLDDASPSKRYAQYPYKEVVENDCYHTRSFRTERFDTIYDIGANVGMFAVKATQTFPGVPIHCFEPVPSTFGYLSKNLARLCPTASAHNFGVGAATQKLPVYYRREDFSGDMVIGKPTKWSKHLHSERAQLLSPSDFVARINPSGRYLVKMDCEGGELPFLRDQAGVNFIKGARIAVFEFHCFDITRAKLEKELRSIFGDRLKLWRAGVSGTFMGMVDNT